MIYVLFSSGIDSWCCLHWAIERFGRENIRAIYFDVGQCYAAKEIAAAHVLCRIARVDFVVREDLKYLLEEDTKTADIPLRNMFFIAMVAAIPNARGVVFGMLRGERPVDKNPVFIRRMQILLNSQRLPGGFCIYTPLRWCSKTSALSIGLKRYGARFEFGVPDTIGCHSATTEPCGICIACFNRWVAMWLTNIICHNPIQTQAPAEWMLNRIVSEGLDSKVLWLFRLRLRTIHPFVALTQYVNLRYRTSMYRLLRLRGAR